MNNAECAVRGSATERARRIAHTNELPIGPTVAMTCMKRGRSSHVGWPTRGFVIRLRSLPSMLVLITLGMLAAHTDGCFHPADGVAADAAPGMTVDMDGSMTVTDRRRLGRRLGVTPVVDVATFEELSDAIDSNVTGKNGYNLYNQAPRWPHAPHTPSRITNHHRISRAHRPRRPRRPRRPH